MWTLWNKIYFIKTVFENFMKWGLKGGISIDADSGPPRYVLWCCGGICHQPDTFIQIGSGHTVQIHIMSVSWHFISFTSLCQTVAGICKYDLGLVWSVNFTNFLVKFLADFLKFDLTVRVGGGRGFNKGGWVWHAHGVHATPMGYVLEGRRLLLPWVNKRFTVVEDR